jgi:hypothetical protein
VLHIQGSMVVDHRLFSECYWCSASNCSGFVWVSSHAHLNNAIPYPTHATVQHVLLRDVCCFWCCCGRCTLGRTCWCAGPTAAARAPCSASWVACGPCSEAGSPSPLRFLPSTLACLSATVCHCVPLSAAVRCEYVLWEGGDRSHPSVPFIISHVPRTSCSTSRRSPS